MQTKILLVDDDTLQRSMISQLVERHLGFPVAHAADGAAALRQMEQDRTGDIKLVLLDMHMPGMNGLEVLQAMRQHFPTLAVIMLTAGAEVDVAVQAIKAGACDFLTKPPELERLRVSVHNALRLNVLEREVTRLKRQSEGTFTFDNLIGHDKGLAETVKVGKKAAASDIPVLLAGETGVGKEAFAKAIHGESHRAGKPFIAVNCGAIPDQLVESTLFGHEKGAFTGAIAKAPGKFREAEGGTIFLDEIGELPLEAQVKLLRVLQQREVSPVGAARSVPVNVRLISASNRDLSAEVAKGRFREDLYFRLNVLYIRIPPLRERREDVPDLARHFIEYFAARESQPLKHISPAALDLLMKNKWPGNVRELENTIHRAHVLSEGDTLAAEDLSIAAMTLAGNSSNGNAAIPAHCLLLLRPNGNLVTMDELEEAAMDFSLAHKNNNITEAAQALGIAKSTFYRKLQQKKKGKE
ncbi:MAG: sigma-54-dependent Fis family transcriptional regulator [Alphaproteobacteria bacterium]|nr:MAG: sigma-54-dependent Fis family transcriptional regulator [Alphaproteobacteria bacterium]